MGADSCISDRLKEIRLSLEYTQTRMGEAVGGKLRSWQEYESGTRMPGGSVFAGLARLGVNVNWILTGEGPQMRTAAQTPGEAAAVDIELLGELLKMLRQHQDKCGRRYVPEDEAAIIAKMYQYVIEEETPTREDRQRVIRLVSKIVGGMDIGTQSTQHDTG